MSEAPPMEVARKYVNLTRRKRELDRELGTLKKDIEAVEVRMLELIESEQLPASFKIDGASVFTRGQVWAAPMGGDHSALATVLGELGMDEYLPKNVNSHSISAFVREHIDPDTGEITGIDPRLLERLKISRSEKVVVNG